MEAVDDNPHFLFNQTHTYLRRDDCVVPSEQKYWVRFGKWSNFIPNSKQLFLTAVDIYFKVWNKFATFNKLFSTFFITFSNISAQWVLCWWFIASILFRMIFFSLLSDNTHRIILHIWSTFLNLGHYRCWKKSGQTVKSRTKHKILIKINAKYPSNPTRISSCSYCCQNSVEFWTHSVYYYFSSVCYFYLILAIRFVPILSMIQAQVIYAYYIWYDCNFHFFHNIIWAMDHGASTKIYPIYYMGYICMWEIFTTISSQWKCFQILIRLYCWWFEKYSLLAEYEVNRFEESHSYHIYCNFPFTKFTSFQAICFNPLFIQSHNVICE